MQLVIVWLEQRSNLHHCQLYFKVDQAQDILAAFRIRGQALPYFNRMELLSTFASAPD
jgi:hypothetical protein